MGLRKVAFGLQLAAPVRCVAWNGAAWAVGSLRTKLEPDPSPPHSSRHSQRAVELNQHPLPLCASLVCR